MTRLPLSPPLGPALAINPSLDSALVFHLRTLRHQLRSRRGALAIEPDAAEVVREIDRLLTVVEQRLEVARAVA